MPRSVTGSILLVTFTACTGVEPAAISAPIGEPLPGLTAEELARFENGAREFSRIFTEQEGLGPRFNENACNACHTDPADGGTGEQLVVKASRTTDSVVCDPMASHGGSNLRRRVTAPAAAGGAVAVPIPNSATHRGRFTTPFLFGVGLVDAVELAELQAMADPDDRDGDGISGRLGRDAAGNPARFGRKANVATLQGFSDEAFRLEMGLTTPTHPDERGAGELPALSSQVDPADEPEITAATLAATVDFVRLLAPPAPRSDTTAMVKRGEELFGSLGCTSCHVPELITGPHQIAALSQQTFALYSDLLLHDMGADLASTCTEGATPEEYRTEPLIGLRYRKSFLHDGRAGRVRDAILLHGGEAAAARQRFANLDRVVQEAVLEFLSTL